MSEETKASRKAIDWEAVEMQYRAGIRSLKEIGAEFGVSDAGIIKRAKRDGWERSSKEVQKDRGVVLTDDLARAGFVYVIFIDAAGERFYKIGMAKTFNERLGSHQTSSPFEVRVACCYYVGDMRAEERVLHFMFDSQRVRGEWFKLSADDLKVIASRSLLEINND